ncbi:MAG TPA: SPOR domain-containing protein [Sphingomonas sp.]|nr:SPOR domain-containing protein [Sphingomonas sp.]
MAALLMEVSRPMRSTLFLSCLLCSALSLAAPAVAQEVVQPLPGTTDADALAADMRRLAANPRDIDALVDAAHLSLTLGDMRAAAALLARADAVDSRNGRVKAGQGSILVQSERPGEALRYFAQAEQFGLNARGFAADRALAYDLLGEQPRAQRDYRTALQAAPTDDETIRRYALSLGISGDRQQAIRLLDPLIRRGDRGAWRAQAFVLAMTGDVAGATRIATTMMPGGAAGLGGFFARLPTLPATDRAFAVHFGEVRATPERLADARMAPSLPPLSAEHGAATMVASTSVAVPAPSGRPRRDSRGVQTAAVIAPSNIANRPAPLVAARTPPPPTAPTTGAASVPAATSAGLATQPGRTAIPAGPVPARPVATGPAIVAAAAAMPAPGTGVARDVTAQAAPTGISTGISPTQQTTTPVTVTPERQATAAATPLPTPGFSIAPAAATPAPQVASAVRMPAPVAPVPAGTLRSLASTRASEDTILARIVANLSVPAAELGVEAPRATVAQAVAAPVAAPQPSDVDRLAAGKLQRAKALADKKAADRKAAADKKTLTQKKADAAAKVVADREVAEEKRLARANPERIWVQVSGGANERDLPRAFGAVKAKAPAVFGSRAGWSTPLRATNRVLTGPFKTDAEARQFVNDLKKEGVSAFTFTSESGQDVTRLGSKSGRADADDDQPSDKKKASETRDAEKKQPEKKATRKGSRRR